MKFNLVLAAALTIGAADIAFAQDAPAPPPGGGRGGALQAACSADIAPTAPVSPAVARASA